MICAACRDRRHDECRGDAWCDCQHLPPAEPETPEGDHREPGVNWLRQG